MEILRNDYYEICYPKEYKDTIEDILNYSTNKLIDNLKFFDKESYEKIIKASFFDDRESFIARIHELDENANPPEWATGCFYGEENQILLDKDNIRSKFLTLAHETCHLLFSKFIYNNYNNRIVWLDESFAANFSGEVDRELENGRFIELIKKYMDCNNLPIMNDISFKNNNIKTKDYNAYDLFHIVGRYLIDNYSKEELLKLYKDQEKVLILGNNILNESLLYFKKQYCL